MLRSIARPLSRAVVRTSAAIASVSVAVRPAAIAVARTAVTPVRSVAQPVRAVCYHSSISHAGGVAHGAWLHNDIGMANSYQQANGMMYQNTPQMYSYQHPHLALPHLVYIISQLSLVDILIWYGMVWMGWYSCD